MYTVQVHVRMYMYFLKKFLPRTKIEFFEIVNNKQMEVPAHLADISEEMKNVYE